MRCRARNATRLVNTQHDQVCAAILGNLEDLFSDGAPFHDKIGHAPELSLQTGQSWPSAAWKTRSGPAEPRIAHFRLFNHVEQRQVSLILLREGYRILRSWERTFEIRGVKYPGDFAPGFRFGR